MEQPLDLQTDLLRRFTLNIETSGFETHLLECRLFADKYLQSVLKMTDRCRAVGGDPDFTNTEMIVIALTGGHFRTDTLERIYQPVIANIGGLFSTT